MKNKYMVIVILVLAIAVSIMATILFMNKEDEDTNKVPDADGNVVDDENKDISDEIDETTKEASEVIMGPVKTPEEPVETPEDPEELTQATINEPKIGTYDSSKDLVYTVDSYNRDENHPQYDPDYIDEIGISLTSELPYLNIENNDNVDEINESFRTFYDYVNRLTDYRYFTKYRSYESEEYISIVLEKHVHDYFHLKQENVAVTFDKEMKKNLTRSDILELYGHTEDTLFDTVNNQLMLENGYKATGIFEYGDFGLLTYDEYLGYNIIIDEAGNLTIANMLMLYKKMI